MREQLSTIASENSYPGRTATYSSLCLPDPKPKSHPEIGLSGGPYHWDNVSVEPSPNLGDHPQSSTGKKSSLRLLVLNENVEVRKAFCEVGVNLGFLIEETGRAVTARHILMRKQTDVLLVNVTRRKSATRSLLEEMKILCPDTLIIVMSSCATLASAVDTMRLGACDYLSKPFAVKVLAESLRRAAKRRRFEVERRKLQETLPPEARMSDILGRSTEMEKLYRILSKVAESRHHAMIIGEEGTGKALVARSIHVNGPHASKPFMSLDCKILGSTLLEGELFGHVNGASTGARKGKRGLLASCQGGTLFLNEVGDISLQLQGKLMKALEEKEIRSLGGIKAAPISIRILAATDRDLIGMVTEGRFRMDLYQLLSVVNLRIPPLRGRPEDIAFLAKRFLGKLKHRSGVKRTMSDEALRILENYNWPGNVRELEQSIIRACSHIAGPELRASDLPQQLLNFRRTPNLGQRGALGSRLGTVAEAAGAEEDILSIAQLEQSAILKALRQTNGAKLQTARLLGIGKTTLYRKLKEYGLGDETKLSFSNPVFGRLAPAS